MQILRDSVIMDGMIRPLQPLHSPRRGPRRGLRPRGLAAFLALLALLALAGCAKDYVTGKNELVLMSTADEKAIDEEAARQVAHQIGLVEDEALAAYVDAVGQAMARHSPRQDVRYHFHVIAMDEPNAFALPGGHIYVSRGLLAIMNDESELANVLGHEIGHVAARHAAERDALQKVLAIMNVIGYIGVAAGGARHNGNPGPIGNPGIFAYSRDQESEADRIGMDLAIQAGVDPAGMASLLRQLDAHTRREHGVVHRTGYFDTHPAAGERAAEAATRAEVARWEPGLAIARDRADFLARLGDLTVGPPASEGVVRDNLFLHPELGIALRFPYGWDVRNTRNAVIGVSRDRTGVVLLEPGGEGDDPRAAAASYARAAGVPLRDGADVRIGELEAHRARGVMPTPAGPQSAEVTFIAHEGMIYRLSGFSPRGRGDAHRGIFRAFARGFRPIRADEYALVDDLRLRVARARAGETLEALSERTGNAWPLAETAVANDLRIHDTLEEGQLVKIAIRRPWSGGRDRVTRQEGEPELEAGASQGGRLR